VPTQEAAAKIMDKKNMQIKHYTSQIRLQRQKNDSILINNIEQVKAIKSPDMMFKQNYTPIV